MLAIWRTRKIALSFTYLDSRQVFVDDTAASQLLQERLVALVEDRLLLRIVHLLGRSDWVCRAHLPELLLRLVGQHLHLLRFDEWD